jgi:ADP-ribosyl-[dinitrogen reductase] hydrolase
MQSPDAKLNSRTTLERLSKSASLRSSEVPPKGSFLSDIVQVCSENGYALHHFTSDDPNVVLLGDYHPDNSSWCTERLESILQRVVRAGDTVFLEGAEGEVIYDMFNMTESAIYGIRDLLKRLRVPSYFNDSDNLIGRLEKLKTLLPEDYRTLDPGAASVVTEWHRLHDERDTIMVEGFFGLKRHQGHRYQIVGLAHLIAGTIPDKLTEAGLSYALFLPTQIPSEQDVAAHRAASRALSAESIDQQIPAILALRKYPTRSAQRNLVAALDDQKAAVRRYAAQALGTQGSVHSIVPLLKSARDPDELVRWTVHRALARFSDPRIEELAGRYLKSSKNPQWSYAALLMHERVYPSLQPLIEAGMKKRSPFVRSLATRLASRYSKIDPMQVRDLLDDENPAVREEAGRFLAARVGRAELSERQADSMPTHFGIRQLGSLQDSDAVRGSLWGVFIGDARGAPVESFTLERIRREFGEVRGYVSVPSNRYRTLPPGSHTDDGEMTLAMMASLTKNKGFSAMALSADFGQIAQSIDDDFSLNCGYGYAALMALREIYAGVNWRFSGNNSEGCGAAMRIAPLAAFETLDPESIIEQAQITHQNSVAIGSAMAMAKAIHGAYMLAPGFNRDRYIDNIADFCSQVSPAMAWEVRNLRTLLDEDATDVLERLPLGPEKHYRKGKGALAVIPAAIYCFLKSPEDFESTVTMGVNTSGDSDSIASMAGAISGAYNGYARIPQPLISGLHERKRIEVAIDRFVLWHAGRV